MAALTKYLLASREEGEAPPIVVKRCHRGLRSGNEKDPPSSLEGFTIETFLRSCSKWQRSAIVKSLPSIPLSELSTETGHVSLPPPLVGVSSIGQAIIPFPNPKEGEEGGRMVVSGSRGEASSLLMPPDISWPNLNCVFSPSLPAQGKRRDREWTEKKKNVVIVLSGTRSLSLFSPP